MRTRALIAAIALVVTFIGLPPGTFFAANEKYAPVKAIGFGPLAGEMISPVSCGLDEASRIYIVDGASRVGSIYLPDGKFFKTFVIPDEIVIEDLKPYLSVVYGNVCYTQKTQIIVASRDGDVSRRINFSPQIRVTSPVSVLLKNDYSLVVCDRKYGVVKLSPDGKFQSSGVVVGVDVKEIGDADITPDGKVAILSIEQKKPEEGQEGKELMNIISVKMFDLTLKKLNEIKVSEERFSPNYALVRLDKLGNIYIIGIDMPGVKVFDKNGNKIAEFSVGDMSKLVKNVAIGTNGNLNVVDGADFTIFNSQGKPIGVYGKFQGQQMQFGNPKDIAPCGNDGLAVYDKQRNDVQFFNQSRQPAVRSFGKDKVEITLSANQEGDLFMYMQGNSTIKRYSCGGTPGDVINLGKIADHLDSFVFSKEGDIWGVSSRNTQVYHFNRLGDLIKFFGTLGVLEGQLSEPSDLFVGPDGNVYVLDSGNSRVQIFKPDGTFVRLIEVAQGTPLKKPKGMCLTEDLEIVIADTGNDRIVVFSLDGTLLYATGTTSSAIPKDTIGDYWKNLGTYIHPTKVRASKEIVYVLDEGNLRVQVLQKTKVEPKVAVDVKEIDFGSDLSAEAKQFVVTNSGSGLLEGSIFADVDWIVLSKDILSGNETKIKIKLVPEKLSWWGADGKITVRSNGGNVEIVVKAVKKGKLISLQVGSIDAKIDEKAVALDVAPRIVSGSTVVPLRFIGEALGAVVEWEGNEKRVTYKLENRVVVLWIGKKEALVNGNSVTLSVEPLIVSGKTLVPLRFISEALGATVQWVAETKTINIFYPPNPNIK